MKTQEEIADAIKDFLYEDEENRYAFTVIVDEKEKTVTQILKGTSRDLTAMLGAVTCQNKAFREVILEAVDVYHKMKEMNNPHADC